MTDPIEFKTTLFIKIGEITYLSIGMLNLININSAQTIL